MKKYILGIITLVLVITVSAFSISAKKTPVKTMTSTVWFYNGVSSDEAELKDGDNWETTNQGSCQATGTRPCQITANASDQDQLTAYLSSFNKSQILGMSTGRKP
jgi:hypothetical protein